MLRGHPGYSCESQWYGLRHVPRVLLLRRVSPTGFEEARVSGQYGWFDRILLVDEENEIGEQFPHGPARLLTRFGNRFGAVGPVVYPTTEDDRTAVRTRYVAQPRRLVVVNAGAGGEQLVEGYCEGLFSAAVRAARELNQKGLNCHWVMVLGPYYRGSVPSEAPFISVVRYEKYLPALLEAADVVVVRPGFNVTYEALQGGARIVLVPGMSYMENQTEWVQRLRRFPGVSTTTVGSLNSLSTTVEAALSEVPSFRRCITNGASRAAEEIVRIGRKDFDLFHGARLLHVVLLFTADVGVMVKDVLQNAEYKCLSFLEETLDRDLNMFVAPHLTVVPGERLRELRRASAIEGPIVIVDHEDLPRARTILSAHGVSRERWLLVGATVLKEIDCTPSAIGYRLAQLAGSGPQAVIVDLREHSASRAVQSVRLVMEEAVRLGFVLAGAREFTGAVIDSRLLTGSPARLHDHEFHLE